MSHHSQAILYGLVLLVLLPGCGGCGSSAVVDPPPGGPELPVGNDLAPLPQVDRTTTKDFTKSDLDRLAADADRYCQALQQLGCRVAVTVNLSYANVTDADMLNLAFPAATETVNLSETAIGDDTMALLGGVSNLRSVLLSSTKITDRSLSYLQQLPQLVTVDLMNTAVTDEGRAALMTIIEARAAGGTPPRGEPPAGWVFNTAAVSAAKSAEAGMDAYAEAVAKFGGSVELNLDFSRLPLTDADVQQLPLAACVRGIDLSYTQVTDHALTHLRQEAPNLDHIDLVKTAITDAGVKELMAMPQLCEANLEATNISFPIRMELIRALTPHLSERAKRRGR